MSNPGVLAAMAIAVAACSDSTARKEPGPPPAPPPAVVRTDPATAAECPYGGSVVQSGFDANGNGVLDDAEVANRTVLCDDPPAAPPPPLVVRLVGEPAGAHCTLEGTAVQSGHDRNRNGRLDDDEIEHVDYVCGVPLLTRLAAEPPGPRCIAGGVAFLAGRDRNHDDQLGDDEVEQTELVCGDVVSRDVAIQSAADAAALADIAVIDGSLTVDGTALAELALPRLIQVSGGLRIANNPALVHAALSSLQAVRGALALERDDRLASLELPQLRRAGSLVIDGAGLADLGALAALIGVDGDVQISNNAALVSADAPRLQIGGGLDVHGNAALVTLELAAGDEIGGNVTITDNPVLQTVPALDPVIWIRGDVIIARNPALTGPSGGSLARIDGALVLDGNDGLVAPGLAHLAHVGSIEVARCPSITALELPALSDVTSGLDVRGNAGLLHLRLPALHQADLGVFDNPHLPACEVEALFAAIRGDHHQSGNDDTAVCGP